MPTLHRRENGAYYFIARIDGKQKWISLRTKDRTVARDRYREMADRYDRGLLDLKQRKPVPTFQELFDEYLPFCKAHLAPRTYRDTESHVRLFLSPFFGRLRAMDLAPKQLEDFTGLMLSRVDPGTGLPAPYHPRTIKLRLETLRKVLNRAVANKVLPELPCKIKMPKVPRSLPRYAYPAQLVDWLAYLDVPHRLRALLSLMTGITDRDLGYVMLDGYDPHNSMLRFRRPKTTTDIVVPLNVTAKQIMALLVTDNPGPELFPAASVKKAYSIASKAAVENGGKHITPHMLRHSFATLLRSKGIPLSHIQDLLGHHDPASTQVYAHVMPEYLRGSVGMIDVEVDLEALLSAPRKQPKPKESVSKSLAQTKKPVT